MTSSGGIPAAGASRQAFDLLVWLALSAKQRACGPMPMERMTPAVGGSSERPRRRFPDCPSWRPLAADVRLQPVTRCSPRRVRGAGRIRLPGKCSLTFPNLVRMWLLLHPHRDLKDAYAYS